MANHHFISYANHDGREFAKSLHEQLSRLTPPLPTWIDLTEMRLSGGDWDDQIPEPIQDCRTVLFVLTRASATSKSCKLEWSTALKYKKPVLVLRLHDDAEAPPLLQNHPYLDLSQNLADGVKRLVSDLIWLDSPEGELSSLKNRLRDAKRELSITSDEQRQRRITDEIQDLERKIEAQSILVRDPAAAEKRVEASIQARVQLERQPQTEVRAKRSPFINPPPGTAPDYFQNRQDESRFTGDFLADETRCVFTIVGRGGLGKTALVCRLLKFLERGQRPDGVGPLSVDGIVYLSGANSRRITPANIFADVCRLLPDDTSARIDQLFKNPQVSTEAKTQALLAAFPAGRTVLLLDNFEDSLDPDTRKVADPELREVLETILRTSGHALKVIITSRLMPSDVTLVQPSRQGHIYLREGLESPYAENILREMDTDGRLGLKSAPAALLATARERTGGFPKALEALVAILAADADASLADVLSSAARVLPEQVQQVLVGEAFNRLDAPTQKVMQALAVYARPVPTVAVDYMLQPHVHGIDAAPLLARLANMYFVRKEQSRYYLHPVDREYALAKVAIGSRDDSDENFTRNSLWRRAAEYFQQARLPRDSWKRREDLEPQLAEFEMRVSCGDFDQAAAVLLDIGSRYLYRWGHYRLVVDLYEQLAGR